MNTTELSDSSHTRIRLMPESLANQIAAGEVVQRPASVVKELLENALDAGANRLILQLREAGKNLIQLTDNGCGMSPLDARMAFERHATSKLFTLDDLFCIQTMGFRGEALASIAAVAQVELRTRLHTEAIGTLIRIEGGQYKTQESCVTPAGTSIAVHNLFYNVPARRNFLKSNTVELRHIQQEFARIALAYPDLHFELYHNNQTLHILPPAQPQERICSLQNVPHDALIELDAPDEFLSIKGWILNPHHPRNFKGDQFLWVNGRYIRSSYLNHAIKRAYESVLESVEHPIFYLHLATDPKNIDINIHPTKTEIKFNDEVLSYQLVFQAVRNTLLKSLQQNNKSIHIRAQTNQTKEPPVSLTLESEMITVRPSKDSAQFYSSRLSPSTNSIHLNPTAFPSKKNVEEKSTWFLPPTSSEPSRLEPLFEVESWHIQPLKFGLVWATYQEEHWLISVTRIVFALAQASAQKPDLEYKIQPGQAFWPEQEGEKRVLLLGHRESLTWYLIEPRLIEKGIQTKRLSPQEIEIVEYPPAAKIEEEIKICYSELRDKVKDAAQGAILKNSGNHTNVSNINDLVGLWLKWGKPTHDVQGIRLAHRVDEAFCNQILECFF